MRASSPATDDSAARLIPDIVCGHPDDVKEVQVQSQFRLFVRFWDDTAGVIDMSALVKSPDAGIFGELTNPALFAEVRVECGTVAWPNGADLAPDAMYAALRESGHWVLA